MWVGLYWLAGVSELISGRALRMHRFMFAAALEPTHTVHVSTKNRNSACACRSLWGETAISCAVLPAIVVHWDLESCGIGPQ